VIFLGAGIVAMFVHSVGYMHVEESRKPA
jgi:hypothetical protein